MKFLSCSSELETNIRASCVFMCHCLISSKENEEHSKNLLLQRTYQMDLKIQEIITFKMISGKEEFPVTRTAGPTNQV
jgi:hypothetical protein